MTLLFLIIGSFCITSITCIQNEDNGVTFKDHVPEFKSVPKYAASIVRESKQLTSATCLCPDTNPPNARALLKADLTDEYLLKKKSKKSVVKLWSKHTTLSTGGMRVRKAMLDMAESDSKLWLKRSTYMTFLTTTMLPYVDRMPNLCVFAELVNASMIFERTQDGAALSDALDKLAVTFTEIANMMRNTSLVAAGAPGMAFSLSTSNCYMNGAVYLGNDLWQLNGTLMPCEAMTATLELASSKTYTDQLISLMSTLSLSGAFLDVMDNFNKNLLFEFIDLQSSEVIPACCFPVRTARLQQLVMLFSSEIVRSTKVVQAKYKSSKWRSLKVPSLRNRRPIGF